MHWRYKSTQVPQTLPELKNLLLETREIKEPESFFNPPSPFDITTKQLGINQNELKKAIKLISSVLSSQSSVLVFGDYDADGICATAILWQTLHSLGAQVMPFIPDRARHGYGLSNSAIDDILSESKPDLIITVDNGIVAHKEVKRLKTEGIQVIITDHHQPEDKLPAADAVVHSTKICGASVAWIMARELLHSQDQKSKIPARNATHSVAGGKDQKLFLENQLDLAGIATVTDQMKLVDENRSFAKFGIEALKKTKRPGLLALFADAQVTQAELDTYHINYVIGPRINAMGRLENGLEALRLLSTKDEGRSTQLAKKLGQVNSQRQDITHLALEQAKLNVENWQDENLIIVASSEFHEGVIGLIAGKLVDEFYKPAIAISLHGDMAKGSARSVKGFNITELLRQVSDELVSVGGHPMAAGFSVASSKLEIISSKLKQLAKAQLSADLLERSLKIECELPAELIGEKLIELIDQFAPFGNGNRQPVFALKDWQIIDAKPIGREAKHLKLVIKPSPSTIHHPPFTALAWNQGNLIKELQPGKQIDLAATVEINEWNGRRSVQLNVRDIKS